MADAPDAPNADPLDSARRRARALRQRLERHAAAFPAGRPAALDAAAATLEEVIRALESATDDPAARYNPPGDQPPIH